MPEHGSTERRPPDDIFNDALALAAAQRPSFLERACGGDSALMAEMVEMLRIVEMKPELIEPPAEGCLWERLGRYEIQAECGRGAMGVVYRAYDPDLDRLVAVKVFPGPLASEERTQIRFAREAKLLAAINDERVATIHSLEEHEGTLFITMEYVEGQTLAALLAGQRLSFDTILDLATQIALGLQAAHERKIIHRDLKPANIMVTPEGRLKILDLGIARAIEDAAAPEDGEGWRHPEASSMAGTPGYMSPEQRHEGWADNRADIWAFGAILFECLTGRRFCRIMETEHPSRGTTDRPWHAEPSLRRIPRPVRDLLKRCLNPDPDRRLASIDTAASILASVRKKRSTRSLRMMAWAAMGAVLVLLLIALLPLRSGSQDVVAVDEPQPGQVRALTSDGRVAWSTQFSRPLLGNHLESWWTDSPQTIVRTRDDVLGVLVATEASSTEPVKLWYLDPADGSVVWVQDAGWEAPVNAAGQLRIKWNTLFPSRDSTRPLLLVNLNDSDWYSSALRLLDLDGNMLGDYYHPGPLKYEDIVDLPLEERTALLLTGVNSSARFRDEVTPFETPRHCACVILIDDPGIEGQAYPYSENMPEPRDWPGMPRARERAYLLIPMVHPSLGAEINWLRTVPEPDGPTIFELYTHDGRLIKLDEDLRPLSCYLSVDGPAYDLNASMELYSPPYLHIRRGEMELIEITMTFDE